MLLKINERKRWVDPSLLKSNPAQLGLQDEEIFQTARLVKYVILANLFFGETPIGGAPLDLEDGILALPVVVHLHLKMHMHQGKFWKEKRDKWMVERGSCFSQLESMRRLTLEVF